jgi:hypothetical protein
MELALGLEVLRNAAYGKPPSSRGIQQIIEQLSATFGTAETDAYQMSFSGNPDELGQWRGYAANGMGCSVVTDAVAVHEVAGVAGWVIYDPRKQKAFANKVLSRLRKTNGSDLVQQVLIAAASYIKHDGFSQEEEFRLLKFPSPGDVNSGKAATGSCHMWITLPSPLCHCRSAAS